MIRRISIVLTVALCGALCGAQICSARAPSASDLVAHAQTHVEDGSIDPARDLEPLLSALRATRDEGDQRSLIDAVADLGAARGGSPAAVKAWFLANAPTVLLDVARGNSDWSVRGDALMALRALDAPDDVLDQAIAIARADASPQSGFLHSRGALLYDWKKSRHGSSNPNAAARPVDAGKEQRALVFLRQRDVGVSVQSLQRAASEGEAETVAALIDAGIDVNAPIGELNALGSATQLACASSRGGSIQAQFAVIDELVRRGIDVNKADALGNTTLIGAVQSCPLAVIEKMLAVGAKPDPVNAQGFTPLKMALVSGHWDIADALVGKGARLSAKDADQLFFEKPQDPAQRAILDRAIGKVR